MKLIDTIVRQPVTIAVGVILILMAGVIALQRIPIQLTPNVEDTIIAVTTRWEGASPQEIEQEIVDKQEEKLQGIANVKAVTSASQQGQGQIRLEFAVGTPKEEALREVSDKLREVPDYPENADEPVIEASDPENQDYIAWIIFSTTDPELDIRTLQDFAEDRIKPRLERISGMSEIGVLGGREREVQIRYDPELLAQRGISPAALVAAIRAANRNVSAGDVDEGKRSVRVRTIGQYDRVSDVEATIVAYDIGGPVMLRDVATVVETYKEPSSFVRSRGEQVIAINAQKEVGANVMGVMQRLREAIDELNRPGGVLDSEAQTRGLNGELNLAQVYDQTIYIDDALALVQDNIWLGGGLAMLVLLLFLRSIRSAGVIALAIPISMIGAVVVMVGLGRSINVISLAGMAFAVGMVVDNAIVVLENIYRHLEMGKRPMQAAIDGAREVWGAVLAATLTTIVVFIPILLIEEEAGQLFRDIALAICAAVGLSLVVSITVIPTVSARLMRQKSPETGPKKKRSKVFRILTLQFVPDFIAGVVYRFSGSVILRLLVVILFTGAAIAGTILLRPPADYLPTGNRNLVFGLMIPPSGYSLDQRQELARRVEGTIRPFWEAASHEPGTPEYERAVLSLPSVPTFDYEKGAPGEPVVPPPVENYFAVSLDNVMFHGAISAIPERVVDLKHLFGHASRGDVLPGVMAFAFQLPLFRLGGTTGSAVKINFSGDDLEKVSAAAEAVLFQLGQKHGFQTVQPDPSNFNVLGPEFQVHPKRVRLSTAGLTPEDLALAVQTSGDGAIIGEYRIGGETIDLKLISEAEDGARLEKLEDIPISTPTGQVVTLGSVGRLERTATPQQINRVGRQRSVTLQFTAPDGLPLEQAVEDIDAILTQQRAAGAIPPDVQTGFTGSASKLASVQEAMLGNGTVLGTLNSSLVLALVVVYLLMCVLFQSFTSPLVILFSVPLATLGGFAALYGVWEWSKSDPYMPVQKLDVLTMLGFVILIGVVVNNAILIVHQTLNFMRGVADSGEAGSERLAAREAIRESVRSRVRPIFMSTMTSIGGMAPLVLMPGSGSELYRGLGSVVIGGLLVSTLFTLFLVPMLFSLVLDAQAALARLRQGSDETEEHKGRGPVGVPAATSWLLFALAVFAVGCQPPHTRGRFPEMSQTADDIVRRELDPVEAEGRWAIPPLEASRVEEALGDRLPEIEASTDPAKLESVDVEVGPDLTGERSPARPIRLEEAVRTALENNLEIRLAQLAPQREGEDVIIAEADFDTALFAAFDFAKQREPQTVPVLNGFPLGVDNTASEHERLEAGVRKKFLPGTSVELSSFIDRFDNDTRGIDFQPDPAWRSGWALTLRQPVLRGAGALVNGSDIALEENERRIAEHDLGTSMLFVVAAVEQAYWELHLARLGLAVREELLQQGLEVQQVLEQRRQFDTTPAQYADALATVEERRTDLIRSRRQLRAVSDRLKVLLNDPEIPLGDEDLLVPADGLETPALDMTLKEAVRSAVESRPEVKQALIEIESNALREAVAENLRLPQLDVTGEVFWTSLEKRAGRSIENSINDDFFSVLVGVELELPILNRLATASHRKAIIERRESLIRFRSTVQTVITEVKNSLRDLQTAYDLVPATRSVRIGQTENLRALLAEEELRSAPTPEFLNLKFQRQEQLAGARLRELEALTDYRRALAAFHQAIGRGLNGAPIELHDVD
ncbi:MAG: efflux RND transporter permease subunit [Planctomycetota bacterium]